MQSPGRLPSTEAHVLGIPRVRQMIDTRQHQGRKHLAIGRDTAHRYATDADPVIATLTANHAEAGSLATLTVVRNGNLERRIDRLGARIDEKHPILGSPREPSDASC